MKRISVRELRQAEGAVLDAASRGDRYAITRHGRIAAALVSPGDLERLEGMSEERETERETTGDGDDVEALVLNALALADGDAAIARRILAEALVKLADK